MSDMNIPSFDAAIEAYENGGEKAAKREEAKLAKFNQLTTRTSDLQIKVLKQQQKLQKSYYDASIDSVQVYLDLQVLQKELDAAKALTSALFPNGIMAGAQAATTA